MKQISLRGQFPTSQEREAISTALGMAQQLQKLTIIAMSTIFVDDLCDSIRSSFPTLEQLVLISTKGYAITHSDVLLGFTSLQHLITTMNVWNTNSTLKLPNAVSLSLLSESHVYR